GLHHATTSVPARVDCRLQFKRVSGTAVRQDPLGDNGDRDRFRRTSRGSHHRRRERGERHRHRLAAIVMRPMVTVRIVIGRSTMNARMFKTVKLLTASSGPAANAAVAPQRLANASTPPWDEARVASDTTAANSADPLTLTHDQPRPRSISDAMIHPVSFGMTAPMSSDAKKI